MELFEADGKDRECHPGWPEFARFDCSAWSPRVEGSRRAASLAAGSSPAALVVRRAASLVEERWSRWELTRRIPTSFDVRTAAELDALLAKFDAALTIELTLRRSRQDHRGGPCHHRMDRETPARAEPASCGEDGRETPRR